MDKMYFTITGLCYRFGNEVFEKGMTVRIEKEPDNEFDKEAIKVMIDGLGKVGYVANSPKTVRGESFSAGRLYDKIDDIAYGEVMFVLEDGIVCRVLETSDK